MQKYFWIFIFPFVLLFSDLLGQDLFKEAEQYFQNGMYRDASVAFERVYFWEPDAAIRAQANLGRAQSLRMLEEYQQALRVLDRTRYRRLDEQLHFEIRTERILLQYLSKNWQEVVVEIDQLNFFLRTFDQNPNVEYLRVLALNELGRWDDARLIAENLYQSQQNWNELNGQYNNQPRLLKEKRGGWLSLFIPGSGQLYAGKPGEAAVSATLQLGSLAWMGYNVANGYYATGLLSGGGLFQSFYFGALDRTEVLTARENIFRKNTYNEKLRNHILQLEESRRN